MVCRNESDPRHITDSNWFNSHPLLSGNGNPICLQGSWRAAMKNAQDPHQITNSRILWGKAWHKTNILYAGRPLKVSSTNSQRITRPDYYNNSLISRLPCLWESKQQTTDSPILSHFPSPEQPCHLIGHVHILWWMGSYTGLLKKREYLSPYLVAALNQYWKIG